MSQRLQRVPGFLEHGHTPVKKSLPGFFRRFHEIKILESSFGVGENRHDGLTRFLCRVLQGLGEFPKGNRFPDRPAGGPGNLPEMVKEKDHDLQIDSVIPGGQAQDSVDRLRRRVRVGHVDRVGGAGTRPGQEILDIFFRSSGKEGMSIPKDSAKSQAAMPRAPRRQ